MTLLGRLLPEFEHNATGGETSISADGSARA
jgi:hypothetical protein